MIAAFWGPTLDCPRPRDLAGFYQRIAGGEIGADDKFFTELRLPGGVGLGFQRDPAHRPPTWPDPLVPQQCHLDFKTADLDTAEAAAIATIAAGAVVAETQPEPSTFRVLLDPAGHPSA